MRWSLCVAFRRAISLIGRFLRQIVVHSHLGKRQVTKPNSSRHPLSEACRPRRTSQQRRACAPPWRRSQAWEPSLAQKGRTSVCDRVTPDGRREPLLRGLRHRVGRSAGRSLPRARPAVRDRLPPLHYLHHLARCSRFGWSSVWRLSDSAAAARHHRMAEARPPVQQDAARRSRGHLPPLVGGILC